MVKQTVTSASTSINKNKLPAIYSKVIIDKNDIVLDYGCGKYTKHIIDYCTNKQAQWIGFDKYNQTAEYNEKSRDLAKNCKPTIGIISNVLNVIDSDDVIKEIIEEVQTMVKGKIYITIYQGDKSNIGKYRKDSFQRNMDIKSYIPLLEKLGFNNIELKNGMIIL